MSYTLPKFALEELVYPLVKASAELARLDERIGRSPIRDGFLERSHFAEACASLWIDGELVHAEELVLHDAGQDVRAPSHELTIAREVLRTRRRMDGECKNWCFSATSINAFRRHGKTEATSETANAIAPERKQMPLATDDEGLDHLSREIAEMDALLARSELTLQDAVGRTVEQRTRDPLIYDIDWNEDARLNEWLQFVSRVHHQPAMLQAAILLDAWEKIEVFQRQSWLGRLLVSANLRNTASISLLPSLNLGLKSIPREERTHRKIEVRLLAFLRAIQFAAEQGLKEHDRLLLAKQLMERRLIGRRASSRLPEVVKIVLTKPVVSAEMVADAAQITQRAALRLIEELNLREMTGRGRFRAWGIL